MLRNLRIRNFKGWKDTGLINLAPVTVLFGSNSSGKSSIGQFLVMLKQTVRQSDRKTVLLLNGPQASVDLGSVADVFYDHSLESNMSFELKWDMDCKSQIENIAAKEYYNQIVFAAEIKVSDPETQYLEVNKFNYSLYNNDDLKLSVGMKKEIDEGSNRNYTLESDKEFKRTKGRGGKLIEPVKFYGFSDAALAYYRDSDFLQDLNLYQEDFFQNSIILDL